ncbi:hypothetical protein GYH30_031470 [Glycine max]|nr:hypothetical protein GYH30_031470 [Glycine max]
MKCLTQEEITSHRKRGLCFNCNEKFHRGHRCASRAFLLIMEDEDTPWPHIDPNDPTPDPPKNPDPNPAQISFNSLSGHLAPKTLCLIGILSAHRVVLLVI